MKKKRILIIYTGGTIGMTRTDHGYAPQKEAFHQLLHQIPELYSSAMPDWDMVDMDPLLDSSNITVVETNNGRIDTIARCTPRLFRGVQRGCIV